MADGAIVFALANPAPRSTRSRRSEHAAVVATRPQRLAQPDQQRARLPRRLPRAARRASHSITIDMLLAAARALAAVVSPDELNAAYIVPSVFHPDVADRGRPPPSARPSGDAGASVGPVEPEPQHA